MLRNGTSSEWWVPVQTVSSILLLYLALYKQWDIPYKKFTLHSHKTRKNNKET